jgi:cytidylate kinase
MNERLVITIDGPVGSGKSTVARALADRLGFRTLDSGAMYRAVTLRALRAGVDMEDPAALTAVARDCDIRLAPGPDGVRVLLDGEDVTREIRSLEVTNHAFYPSQTPGVRRRMVELQRREAAAGPLVAEGRDMGTVVFPDAPAKFYLDASVEERARRRHRDHVARRDPISLAELRRQIELRDRRDSEREASPLRPAGDAVRIDSSDLTVEGVVDAMVAVLRERDLAGDEPA